MCWILRGFCAGFGGERVGSLGDDEKRGVSV